MTPAGNDNWTRDGLLGYDPDRWNPDDRPDDCQVCGTELCGAGDRSTMGQYCPECDVSVWIR